MIPSNFEMKPTQMEVGFFLQVIKYIQKELLPLFEKGLQVAELSSSMKVKSLELQTLKERSDTLQIKFQISFGRVNTTQACFDEMERSWQEAFVEDMKKKDEELRTLQELTQLQETVASQSQRIDSQQEKIASLLSSKGCEEEPSDEDDQTDLVSRLAECCQAIRVRKYELGNMFSRTDEDSVQRGNIVAHQGCAAVDAYLFKTGKLATDKHLETFNKYYGPVTPETVWDGRDCRKYIQVLDWRCGLVRFGFGSGCGSFARYRKTLLKGSKYTNAIEIEKYFTENAKGPAAWQEMEREYNEEYAIYKLRVADKSRKGKGRG